MALVTTHRFNWMGYEGTESEALNLAMMRPGGDLEKGNLKYQDYQRRQAVMAEIQQRLRTIKQELGLLPPEEEKNEENGELENDEEDVIHLATEDDEDEEEAARQREREAERRLAEQKEAEEAARVAEEERRAEEVARKKREIDEALAALNAGDGNGPQWQYEPTPQEMANAISGVSGGIRTLLARKDAYLVSYLNASHHPSEPVVDAFNVHNRPVVENAIQHGDSDLTLDSIPPAESFSVETLQALYAKVEETRKKYEAARIAENPAYCKNVRYEELNANLTSTTSYDAQVDGEVPQLSANFTQSKEAYASARKEYNTRALAAAQKLLEEEDIANLHLTSP